MKLNTITAGIAMALSQQVQETGRTSGGTATGSAATSAGKRGFSKKKYDQESGVVSFIFEPGTDQEETISCNVYEFPDHIQQRLTCHGMSQKGGDSYASVKGNVAEAKANLRDVISELQAGNWEGEGEGGPRLADLAAAIARIRSAPLEKVTQVVEAATDEKRKEWRSNAQVKAMIAKIRAEQAAARLEQAGEQKLDIDLQ